MSTVASPGEGVGLRGRLLIRVARRLAWVGVLVLGWAVAPAQADALYRCTGTSGETVFASQTTGYTACKKLDVPSSVRAVRKAPPVAKAVAAPPLAPAAPIVAPKGHWDYQESKTEAPAIASAPPVPQGAKVLRGAVYRVARADGSVEYTNIRPGEGKGHAVTMLFSYIATCAACDLRSPINWDVVPLNMTAYSDVIHSASGEFGVDEALLRAVIHAESAFNPRALSIKGAQGLMQLMPATGRDMGVGDAFDAGQNIRGGARYLALLLRSFNGDERLAAAAYNAGQGAVVKYKGVPPYAETQVYVERVGTLRKRYGVAERVGPLAERGS
jgi:hypothetical protein